MHRPANEPTTPVRGLPGASGPRPFALRRIRPAPDLAWCVEHHWFVPWVY